MFLITTANEDTWKKDESVLFLGEWCKKYSRKSAWSSLDFEVLPYHWDDRERYYQDYKKLGIIYEKYLKQTALLLNDYHDCDHSLRYWRIVIGFWLIYFINILFDRYISIKTARKYQTIDSTFVMKNDWEKWVPSDYLDFRNQFRTDNWNHFIYGELIKYLDEIPYEIICLDNIPNNKKSKTNGFNKKVIKKIINQYKNWIPDSMNQVVFVDHTFNTFDIIKLQLSLKQFPFPHYYSNLDMGIETLDLVFRQNDKLYSGDSEFDQFLNKSIPRLIPSAYLENYKTIKERSLEFYPSKISAIYTSGSYSGNEGFKIWAAEKTNCGSKLIIGPHGGGFGNSLFDQSLDHQLNISDCYFSWGWESPNKKLSVKPLPAGKLISTKKKIKPMSSGDILLVCASFPRYFYYMGSYPTAGQFLKYIDDQLSFISNISEKASSSLKIRLHRQRRGLGWDIGLRLKDHGYESLIDTNNLNLYNRINQSRLCIATYNATVFLETFTANFPTILFWDPEHSENNTLAQPYFEELRKVGILHDSPETAAKKVNEIYNDPITWWNQPEIQITLKKFCKKFAYVGNNWINEWKTELQSLID